MVAVKANQAQAFISSIGPRMEAVLVFGMDEGLISERARAVAEKMKAASTPPGEIVRIGDADLEADPDRLALELKTIAMFGERKIVRTEMSRRVTAASLKALLAEGGLEGRLVIEAGSLKADDSLRVLFEKSENLAALACYGDEGQDLERLVGEVLREAGKDIASDARAMLIERLGADRWLSRSELDKLVLYVGARKRIEADDIEAVVGDASAQSLDRVLHAMATGDRATALKELDRALAAGEHPQMIIATVQRHVHRLHRALTQMESGRQLADIIRLMRPPLFYKARDAFMVEVRCWTAARCSEAVARAATALMTARSKSHLESIACERLVMEIATLGARGQKTRGSPS